LLSNTEFFLNQIDEFKSQLKQKDIDMGD